MFNWPEMLHHAEDWANGFWTGAASASIIGIVAAAAALPSVIGGPGSALTGGLCQFEAG